MFDNIGGKLNVLAVAGAWIGIIAFVIYGFTIMVSANNGFWGFLLGSLIIVFGSLASWLGSLPLYGLGQLIEDTESIKNQINYPPEHKTNLSDIKPIKSLAPEDEKTHI